MLSRLAITSSLFKNCPTKFANVGQIKQNFISKRFSGHNTMDIVPSNAVTKMSNNWEHFYVLLAAIPLAVITTIINIRANPELTEVPEGYEPRHWEYFRHPIARWSARYLVDSAEKEHEMYASLYEMHCENRILTDITKNVEVVMRFYNDHRSLFFYPFFAEQYRYGREQSTRSSIKHSSNPNELSYNMVFDKDVKAVPYSGYVDPKDRV